MTSFPSDSHDDPAIHFQTNKQKTLLLTFHFPEAGSGPVIAIVIVALIIVIVIVVAVVARAQGILCFAGELILQNLSTPGGFAQFSNFLQYLLKDSQHEKLILIACQ